MGSQKWWFDGKADINIRIYHKCEGRIENSVPRIAVCITRHVEWWHTMIPRDEFFCPTLTRIMDFFLLTTVLFMYFKKLSKIPEYAKMQFIMMTLLDVLGKIAWVRWDFLSQGKISDILIRCARNICTV